MPLNNDLSLKNFPKNSEAEILHVPKHSLLAPLGLRKGKKIKILSSQAFNGPLVVEIEGRQIAVAKDIAAKILVRHEVSAHAAI
ncbi:ferrous iron transport protein A [Halanaerobium sp. Z-7514]|uniref:Ferrous iron transport protein A n=1 Tax=Halanaerobium polyolivorans TaxID=2886943 RepID=A0AAW4WTF3_9FIRM|nr:FeoA family protein [Halanaerobium polyolivorans]MCC3144372.1 ferrous iron transport protein A [Halanaerobium polyolivorans]RQD75331.1 MAG: ferrous iron transport protein A [Halanaerobium sp. MSAO_Bac5]